MSKDSATKSKANSDSLVSVFGLPQQLFQSFSTERKICVAVLSIALLGTVSNIFYNSLDDDVSSGEVEGRVLGDGWTWFGKRKDIADFEWTFWFLDLREHIILALAGHVACALLSAYFIPWCKDIVVSAYCIYCVRAALGLPYVLLVAVHCGLFYFTATWKSNKICWLVTVSNIIILRMDESLQVFSSSFVEESGRLLPLAYSGLAFSALRCSSFVLESNRKQKIKQSSKFTFYELLQYNFYLPYFFFGPVMTYDEYAKKKTNFPTSAQLILIFKDSLKTIIGIILVDFLLHFMHVSSLAVDVNYLRSSPAYIVGCLLFLNVFLDWAKAWILYRLTASIAKIADGHLSPPEGPKCIATLTTFAETYFDRGIQHWVCRYIYDPFGKDHTKVENEALGAFLTFSLVAVWQGASGQVLIWALLNWWGLVFEFIIITMIPWKSKISRHLKVFFLGMNYWTILIYNSIGINGTSTALESSYIMFLNGNISNIVTSLVISFCYASLIIPESAPKAKQQ